MQSVVFAIRTKGIGVIGINKYFWTNKFCIWYWIFSKNLYVFIIINLIYPSFNLPDSQLYPLNLCLINNLEDIDVLLAYEGSLLLLKYGYLTHIFNITKLIGDLYELNIKSRVPYLRDHGQRLKKLFSKFWFLIKIMSANIYVHGDLLVKFWGDCTIFLYTFPIIILYLYPLDCNCNFQDFLDHVAFVFTSWFHLYILGRASNQKCVAQNCAELWGIARNNGARNCPQVKSTCVWNPLLVGLISIYKNNLMTYFTLYKKKFQ